MNTSVQVPIKDVIINSSQLDQLNINSLLKDIHFTQNPRKNCFCGGIGCRLENNKNEIFFTTIYELFFKDVDWIDKNNFNKNAIIDISIYNDNKCFFSVYYSKYFTSFNIPIAYIGAVNAFKEDTENIIHAMENAWDLTL